MEISNNYSTAKVWNTSNKNVSKSSEKNKWKLTDSLKEKIVDLAFFAPAHANRQRAAAVGTLAQVYFAQGIYESADEFVPEYLRKSQAEREREERLHGQK